MIPEQKIPAKNGDVNCTYLTDLGCLYCKTTTF